VDFQIILKSAGTVMGTPLDDYLISEKF